MAASTSPKSKHRYWLMFFGLLSIVLLIVMAILAYLFFITLRVSDARDVPLTITSAPTGSTLSLQTASEPEIISGPTTPQKVNFVAQEPIKGFSNCEGFGLKGIVSTGNGTGLQGVQIVVWEAQKGLLALSNADSEGIYIVDIADEPGLHKLWVQVYENDLPVSEPVFVETQIDCQVGFQVYEINWQRVGR